MSVRNSIHVSRFPRSPPSGHCQYSGQHGTYFASFRHPTASCGRFCWCIAALRSNAPVTRIFFPRSFRVLRRECWSGSSIPHRKAAVYTDSRIVEKYRDQLAQIFTQIGLSFLHSQCQLALEIEMLRKYTILAMLYKLDHKSVCQLTIKDIPALKCAAESKPYEDENEIR